MAEADPNVQEEPETDGKPSITFWLHQLEASKNAAKDHKDDSKKAWEEYLGIATDDATIKTKVAVPFENARYPIFWASVRTIQPALYSRTPIPVSEPMFADAQDTVAKKACGKLERLATYLMRCCPFDRVQYAVRDDFIMTGKATPRVCLDSYISENVAEKVFYTEGQIGQDENGQPIMGYVNAEGQPLEDTSTLMTDETGSFFVESMQETLERVVSELLPVRFDEILHTPNARHWEEIDWIAYRTLQTKQDVEDRFGKDIAEAIPYSDQVAQAAHDTPEVLPTKYAKIWEIWDKRKKQVYWVCDGWNEKILDTKDDPYELECFFPSPPFILGTVGPDSLYPRPDYIQLRPLINQLHGMARRLKTLVLAARRRFIYDASITELDAVAAGTSEAEGVAVSMYQQQIVDKGGLENVVQWFPLEPIVAAIQQMTEVMNQYQAAFNEMYGIPDILRGVTDPQETAAAQQMKGRFLSLRFSAVQREFQRIVRDSIELMCDLALKKFPEDKLEEIMGVRFDPPEDQKLFPQMLLLLKDDVERKVRINIQTDSTITMNEDAQSAQSNELMKTLLDGIQGVANVRQVAPEMAPVAAASLEYLVNSMRDGKKISDKLGAAINQMLNPQPPQGPPPPDYEMLKIQQAQSQTAADFQVESGRNTLQSQQAQMTYILESNKAMNDIRVRMSELQLKAQELQIEAQKVGVMGQKVVVDGQNAAAANQVAGQKTMVEGQKVGVDAQHKQARLSLEAQAQAFSQNMDALMMQLEQQKVRLDETEKYMTEARLQKESELEQARLEEDSVRTRVEASKPQGSPVTIVNAPNQTAPQPMALPTTSLLGLPFARARIPNPFGGL